MLCPAVCDDRVVVAHDEILEAEAGAAQVDATRVDMQHVVEARRHEVAAERLEHERLALEMSEERSQLAAGHR